MRRFLGLAALAAALAAPGVAQYRVEAVPSPSALAAPALPSTIGSAAPILEPRASWSVTVSAPAIFSAPFAALAAPSAAPAAVPAAAALQSAAPTAATPSAVAADPSVAPEAPTEMTAPSRIVPRYERSARGRVSGAERIALGVKFLRGLSTSPRFWDGARQARPLNDKVRGWVFPDGRHAVAPQRPLARPTKARGSARERVSALTLDRLRTGAGSSDEGAPLSWPKWKRWSVLSGLLGAMAVAPPLVRAASFAAPRALGVLHSWPLLVAVAALLALGGIPLRVFAHRLAPWTMTRGKDAGDALMRRGPFSAVPELAVAAAVEEILFRGLLFVGAVMLLHPVLPGIAAVAAASFVSSLIFALIHGYGSVWTRVIGGMLYAGAFVVSGTLLLPIIAHFFYNLALYIRGRYLKAGRISSPSARRAG